MMQTSSVLMAKKKVVTNMAMKIGYIQEIDLQLNPQYKEVDYEEIVDNANIMKKNSKVILVREPFLLDDELRKKKLQSGLSGQMQQIHMNTIHPHKRGLYNG